jgi:hypothetical protein
VANDGAHTVYSSQAGIESMTMCPSSNMKAAGFGTSAAIIKQSFDKITILK